ncbi:uncharacterized protein LOC26527971 isoform X1 [Drosophila mojavensis]|uniref:Uncharacterized protein n=1 Tax=Drosophila mojavensis TaxID=7230 RepID=A0A0Q9XR45_DROMO|nr:uncharacterized protein LOC26527971 isoform X1 [Drosophila mojavensis]KRG06483.1 uncharacterized protein Dmoj_GI26330 [Drosophila mojavensis]
MESSLKTEYLSPPMFSNIQDDVEDNTNASEYTEQFPASAVQTDICVEGNEGSPFGGNVFSTPDPSKKLNYEDAFGYCSYAPSQAFNENCGSPNLHGCYSNENNCLITSNEAANQNYAVDANAWAQPNQTEYTNLGSTVNYTNMDRNTAGLDGYDPQESQDGVSYMNQAAYQYSDLGNIGNYTNMDRNTAGLDAYDPQESQDGVSNMERHAYENWYQSMNVNADQWHISPQQLNENYYQNTNSMQNQTDFISNYQYSYGKGNYFNHFPNGTLMDAFLPGGTNEAFSYYDENSLCPTDYYEGEELLPGQESYTYMRINSQPVSDCTKCQMK